MIKYDLAILAGVSCIAYAGYQVHPALPWLIGGAASAAWGYLGAVRTIGKDKKK